MDSFVKCDKWSTRKSECYFTLSMCPGCSVKPCLIKLGESAHGLYGDMPVLRQRIHPNIHNKTGKSPNKAKPKSQEQKKS